MKLEMIETCGCVTKMVDFCDVPRPVDNSSAPDRAVGDAHQMFEHNTSDQPAWTQPFRAHANCMKGVVR
jgi:hypothetical protein